MRLFTALALSFLVVSPLALAQAGAGAGGAAPAAPPSPAAMQLAGKLYDDIHVDSVFKSIGGNLVEGELGAAGRVAGDRGSCQALRPTAQTFVAKLEPIFSGLADAQFRQSAVTVYANNFTEDELRQITSFIESPAGKKFNAVGPQVGQQVQALAEAKVKPHEAQIRAAMNEFEGSFKTALATCPAAPGSAAPAPTTPAPKKRVR